jgi:hypothetical protein
LAPKAEVSRQGSEGDTHLAEMAGWSPDRIAAFFAGLAQVLAAKKGTEEIQ